MVRGWLLGLLLSWTARLDWCGGCGDEECADCEAEWPRDFARE